MPTHTLTHNPLFGIYFPVIGEFRSLSSLKLRTKDVCRPTAGKAIGIVVVCGDLDAGNLCDHTVRQGVSEICNDAMEKYFRNTLSNSAYIWPADKLSIARSHLLEAKIYDSEVSRNLITWTSKGQVACFFIVLMFGEALVCRYIGKDAKTRLSI